MNVWSTPNSVWDREYTVPSGGLAPSSKSMQRLYLRYGASMVALALLKTSAKLWYAAGTPAILRVSTGGEVAAERSFVSSAQCHTPNIFGTVDIGIISPVFQKLKSFFKNISIGLKHLEEDCG